MASPPRHRAFRRLPRDGAGPMSTAKCRGNPIMMLMRLSLRRVSCEMGRGRKAGVRLPKGVERVRARGRTYYYWNPGRGTDRESERIPLPNADNRPVDFW